MENWRVLLAEGQPELRQHFIKLLAEMPGVTLVAKVSNGWDVMFTSSQLQPDIVIVDFTMPGLGGAEVVRLLKRGLPGALSVIMLSDDEGDEAHVKAVERCGADAYLMKSRVDQELPIILKMLEQVKKGSGISD